MIEEVLPTLYPYQEEAAAWLSAKRHALLSHDCGLGKSAIAITALDLAKVDDVLVICPAVATTNWIREFQKFSKTNRTVQVVSYAMAHKTPISQVGCLILDESHFLKSTESLRTRAILGKNGHAHAAARVWCLSATPCPNNASELWPMLYTFGVTKLKFADFVKRFCTVRQFHLPKNTMHPVTQITGTNTKAIPELKSMLQNVMLRKTKEEVLDLPPISFRDLFIEPKAELPNLRESIAFSSYTMPGKSKDQLFAKLEKERDLVRSVMKATRPATTDEGMQALSGIANSVSTLRMWNGFLKVKPLAELLNDELDSNAYEKIVVFAIHRDVIAGLRNRLRRHHPVTLFGGTPPEKRQENVDKFQRYKKFRVFIGNIHAAGTAVTLTAAHQVLFAEMDWVPGNNMQAAMRCHRIGQKNHVMVRCASIADSIDEEVNRALRRKTRELAMLFGRDCLQANNLPAESTKHLEFINANIHDQRKELFDLLS